MHYYKHHIGDYRKDTGHLSPLEHGVYRQLIDQYYLDEKPLPSDLQKVFRIAGARSDEEKQAVKNVLSDFFLETENGFFHKRCDGELQRIYEKSEQASNAAKMRWKCGRNADASESNADALKNDADEMLPITHNPITQQSIGGVCGEAINWLVENGEKEKEATEVVTKIADEFAVKWVDEALTACKTTPNKVGKPLAYFKKVAADKYREYRQTLGVQL